MMNFLRKQMKLVMAIIVVAFLLSTFLMYEGRGTRHTPVVNADGTMSDYEVAQINGRSLMRSELERRLRDYLSNYNSRSAESLDMPAIYQAVLDQTILESQLAKEVDESGIRVSDAEADQAMKNYADTYFPTRETFYQVLENSGIKVEDYKRNLARQMAVEQLLNNAVGEVNISEDKAVEFYDTMKNLIYSRPEGFMIHAANFHKKEDAEVLREKLVAGGSWDVIVSNDELASNDVINITREPVFLPTTALTTGAFSVLSSLDVGVVSPVFEVTSSDFAVGLKTSHVDASVTPYDEVSADIRGLLTQQEQRNRLAAYEESLKNKAQVTINDASLFARNAVTSPDETVPEMLIDEVAEVSSDSETESEAKSEAESESKDATAPEIVIEEVKEEEAATETVTEESKPEETSTSTSTEETKSEAVETVNQEVNAEETKTEVTEPVTETSVEVKSEETAEETKQNTEAATETVTEEVKPEATSLVEESKPEATEAVTVTETANEEAKPEEAEPEAKTEEPVKEAKEASEPVQGETKKEESAKAVTETSSPDVVEGTAEQSE